MNKTIALCIFIGLLLGCTSGDNKPTGPACAGPAVRQGLILGELRQQTKLLKEIRAELIRHNTAR